MVYRRPVFGALLLGKVIGVGIVSLVPFVAGAVPVVARIVSGASVPPDTGTVLAASAVFFVVGGALYAGRWHADFFQGQLGRRPGKR